MWWMFAAQSAMALTSAAAGHAASSEQASAGRKWQKYQNAMTMLSAANSQNAITDNVTLAMEQNADQGLEIQKNQARAEGAARVAAAAAGVSGGSVDATMRDIGRNAAAKQYSRSQTLQGIFLTSDHQRQAVASQAQASLDHNMIPGPNTPAELLGLAGKGLDIYKTYDDDGLFNNMFGSS